MIGASSYTTELFEQRSDSQAMNITGLGTTTNTNATLTGLTVGRNYTFRVCSVNDAGMSCSNLSVNGCKLMFLKIVLLIQIN